MFFIAIAWLLAEFRGMKDEIRERLGINNETIKVKKISVSGKTDTLKKYSDGQIVKLGEDGKFKLPGNDTFQFSLKDMENYLKDKKKVGTETILGKECDIYETAKGVKLSVMKQYIPLKIQTESMTMTAVSMSDKVSIPDSQMEVPSDVKFSDVSGTLKNLKK